VRRRGGGRRERLLLEPFVDSDPSDLSFMAVVDTVAAAAAADHGHDEGRLVSTHGSSSPPLILFYWVHVCAYFAQHKISN
jgi:hypothetical protein